MTTTKAKSKKATNKSFSVIEAARQNVLAIFLLKNISEKLLLVTSGSFSFPLAGNSSLVKVLSKRHTRISLSVVFTTSKSPKIFNNKPVNKLVFPALTTSTTSTISTLQMTTKAKNSKKQQQAITTAMVISNSFVVPDEILEIELSTFPPVSGVVDSGAWINVNGQQKFSGWVASTLVPGATFKIKMALLMAIGNKIFLTTLKIAQSSGVASVSFPSLLVVLHDISLGTSSNDIKTALGIFGIVMSVKLKPAGLWQYAVVNFKDTSSAANVFSYWSVLKAISSKDAFKAKLVNLPFGCTVFEISNMVSQVDYLAVNCKVLPPLLPKLFSNSAGGANIFKSFFIGAKSYTKAATSVVFPVAAAANIVLAFSAPPKGVVSLLPVVFSGSDVAVNARLTFLETQLSKLSLLIKSIVEPVSFLVVLITKILSTPPVMAEAMKKSMVGLGNQINAVHAVASVLQKKMGAIKLRSRKVHFDIFDDENMDDNNNNNNNEVKNFSVYDDTFDAMMELWEVQSFNIKSDLDQTAKWISGFVKSSHELVCIIGKIYELDMFNTLGSKDNINV
ncbi:hypothetical protein G9A89_009314 [Geosiphon pyriformis]|nr:hypothetical protein G9A89_009314 [Geosiphon pyriformis]